VSCFIRTSHTSRQVAPPSAFPWTEVLVENLPQCRFVHQNPHVLPGSEPGSGHVGFCDEQKWRWGRFSPRTSVVSPSNLHSICFSTIIFTITLAWHNRPGVAAVPIASQTRIKIYIIKLSVYLFLSIFFLSFRALFHLIGIKDGLFYVILWPYNKNLRSRKPRLTTMRIRCADHATHSNRKIWHYADKRRSLGRYISPAD
jgi:hypothetical protein